MEIIEESPLPALLPTAPNISVLQKIAENKQSGNSNEMMFSVQFDSNSEAFKSANDKIINDIIANLNDDINLDGCHEICGGTKDDVEFHDAGMSQGKNKSMDNHDINASQHNENRETENIPGVPENVNSDYQNIEMMETEYNLQKSETVPLPKGNKTQEANLDKTKLDLVNADNISQSKSFIGGLPKVDTNASKLVSGLQPDNVGAATNLQHESQVLLLSDKMESKAFSKNDEITSFVGSTEQYIFSDVYKQHKNECLKIEKNFACDFLHLKNTTEEEGNKEVIQNKDIIRNVEDNITSSPVNEKISQDCANSPLTARENKLINDTDYLFYENFENEHDGQACENINDTNPDKRHLSPSLLDSFEFEKSKLYFDVADSMKFGNESENSSTISDLADLNSANNFTENEISNQEELKKLCLRSPNEISSDALGINSSKPNNLNLINVNTNVTCKEKKSLLFDYVKNSVYPHNENANDKHKDAKHLESKNAEENGKNLTKLLDELDLQDEAQNAKDFGKPKVFFTSGITRCKKSFKPPWKNPDDSNELVKIKKGKLEEDKTISHQPQNDVIDLKMKTSIESQLTNKLVGIENNVGLQPKTSGENNENSLVKKSSSSSLQKALEENNAHRRAEETSSAIEDHHHQSLLLKITNRDDISDCVNKEISNEEISSSKSKRELDFNKIKQDDNSDKKKFKANNEVFCLGNKENESMNETNLPYISDHDKITQLRTTHTFPENINDNKDKNLTNDQISALNVDSYTSDYDCEHHGNKEHNENYLHHVSNCTENILPQNNTASLNHLRKQENIAENVKLIQNSEKNLDTPELFVDCEKSIQNRVLGELQPNANLSPLLYENIQNISQNAYDVEIIQQIKRMEGTNIVKKCSYIDEQNAKLMKSDSSKQTDDEMKTFSQDIQKNTNSKETLGTSIGMQNQVNETGEKCPLQMIKTTETNISIDNERSTFEKNLMSTANKYGPLKRKRRRRKIQPVVTNDVGGYMTLRNKRNPTSCNAKKMKTDNCTPCKPIVTIKEEEGTDSDDISIINEFTPNSVERGYHKKERRGRKKGTKAQRFRNSGNLNNQEDTQKKKLLFELIEDKILKAEKIVISESVKNNIDLKNVKEAFVLQCKLKPIIHRLELISMRELDSELIKKRKQLQNNFKELKRKLKNLILNNSYHFDIFSEINNERFPTSRTLKGTGTYVNNSEKNHTVKENPVIKQHSKSFLSSNYPREYKTFPKNLTEEFGENVKIKNNFQNLHLKSETSKFHRIRKNEHNKTISSKPLKLSQQHLITSSLSHSTEIDNENGGSEDINLCQTENEHNLSSDVLDSPLFSNAETDSDDEESNSNLEALLSEVLVDESNLENRYNYSNTDIYKSKTAVVGETNIEHRKNTTRLNSSFQGKMKICDNIDNNLHKLVTEKHPKNIQELEAVNYISQYAKNEVNFPNMKAFETEKAVVAEINLEHEKSSFNLSESVDKSTNTCENINDNFVQSVNRRLSEYSQKVVAPNYISKNIDDKQNLNNEISEKVHSTELLQKYGNRNVSQDTYRCNGNENAIKEICTHLSDTCISDMNTNENSTQGYISSSQKLSPPFLYEHETFTNINKNLKNTSEGTKYDYKTKIQNVEPRQYSQIYNISTELKTVNDSHSESLLKDVNYKTLNSEALPLKSNQLKSELNISEKGKTNFLQREKHPYKRKRKILTSSKKASKNVNVLSPETSLDIVPPENDTNTAPHIFDKKSKSCSQTNSKAIVCENTEIQESTSLLNYQTEDQNNNLYENTKHSENTILNSENSIKSFTGEKVCLTKPEVLDQDLSQSIQFFSLKPHSLCKERPTELLTNTSYIPNTSRLTYPKNHNKISNETTTEMATEYNDICPESQSITVKCLNVNKGNAPLESCADKKLNFLQALKISEKDVQSTQKPQKNFTKKKVLKTSKKAPKYSKVHSPESSFTTAPSVNDTSTAPETSSKRSKASGQAESKIMLAENAEIEDSESFLNDQKMNQKNNFNENPKLSTNIIFSPEKGIKNTTAEKMRLTKPQILVQDLAPSQTIQFFSYSQPPSLCKEKTVGLVTNTSNVPNASRLPHPEMHNKIINEPVVKMASEHNDIFSESLLKNLTGKYLNASKRNVPLGNYTENACNFLQPVRGKDLKLTQKSQKYFIKNLENNSSIMSRGDLKLQLPTFYKNCDISNSIVDSIKEQAENVATNKMTKPELLHLIETDILKPGYRVLTTHTSEKLHFASIDDRGYIISENGKFYIDPYQWCLSIPNFCQKNRNLTNAECYGRIYYQGRRLSHYKGVYQEFINQAGSQDDAKNFEINSRSIVPKRHDQPNIVLNLSQMKLLLHGDNEVEKAIPEEDLWIDINKW